MLPAVFDTTSILEYFKSMTDPLKIYWISGSLVNSVWNWGPTSQSLLVNTTICSLSSNSYNYLFYNDGCYNNNVKDIRSYYICQRYPQLN